VRPPKSKLASELSMAELEALLAKRKQEAQTVPAQLPNPDFSGLVKMVDAELKDAIKAGHMHSNVEHFIVEEVYKAIYGPNFYDWYNKTGIAQ